LQQFILHYYIVHASCLALEILSIIIFSGSFLTTHWVGLVVCFKSQTLKKEDVPIFSHLAFLG